MPLSKFLNYVAPHLSLSLFAGSAYLSTLDHTDGGIGPHVDAILLCLSSSSLASSQLVPISIRSRLTMSIQFLLGYLLYPLSSHCMAWRGILESSILNTCRNHLSLLSLTLWRPLLPYGYSYKEHHVPDRIKLSFVIFDIRALWHSALSTRVPGCQKLQMAA